MIVLVDSKSVYDVGKVINPELARSQMEGGAVMGMSVVGLGLLGVSVVYLILIWHASLREVSPLLQIWEATQLIVGFSLGASSVALFGRVGEASIQRLLT